MKRPILSGFSIFVLLVAFLGTMPPVRAQSLPAAVACNNTAHDPLAPFCLLVPVQRLDGSPLPGARVSAQYGDRGLLGAAGQTIIGLEGEAVAALSLDQLGLRPGEPVSLRVDGGPVPVDLLIGFQPNPATRTQRLDPVVVPASLGPGLIAGTVHLIDQQAPLNAYTVTLHRDVVNGPVLDAAMITPADAPRFALDPGQLPNGTRLWLVVNGAERIARLPLTWETRPITARVVLDWPCVDDAPRAGSGSQLPRAGSGSQLDPFCVYGAVTSGGRAVAGATISAEVLDADPTVYAPGTLAIPPVTSGLPEPPPPGVTEPVYSLDIGQIASAGLAASTRIRFTAVKDNLIGILELTLEQLGIHEVWGVGVAPIALRDEHMLANGTEGGTPSAVAIIGTGNQQATYLTTSGGLVVTRQRPGGSWVALLGNTATMLATPDVTALAGRVGAGGEDFLVAGLLNGTIATSRTSGRTWEPGRAVGVGPVRGIALAGDTLYVAGVRGVARITDLFGTNPIVTTLPTIPGGVRAIAADSAGHVVAGGPSGLFTLTDTTWELIQATAVTAIAMLDSTGAVLVGTASGLFGTATSGGTWTPLGLDQPVTALSVAADAEVWATTQRGLWRGHQSSASFDWSLDTPAEGAATSGPTLGAPTIYELVTQGEHLYAASSTGVWVSDDGGANWHRLNATFAEDTRSIAPLSDGGVLALGLSGLQAVHANGVTALTGFPTVNLNPAVVRLSPDGTMTLIGRHAGPGAHLLVGTGGSWRTLTVGEGRGVTTAAFFPTGPQAGLSAVIGTEGDGVYGLSTTGETLTAFPPLLDGSGQPRQIGAITILATGTSCQLIVGTVSPALIVSRPCDLGSPWVTVSALTTRAGQTVSGVTALAATPGSLFAATSDGYFRGGVAGTWQPVFGLPTRPLALATPADYAISRSLLTGGPQSGIIRLFDAAPDIAVRMTCPEQLRGGSTEQCTVTLTNQGLLPVAPGSLTLTITGAGLTSDSPQPISYPQITAGQQVSATLSLTAPLNARPALATVRLEAPPAPGETFTANNIDRRTIQIQYREAPDPAISIGGETMTRQGSQGTLSLTVVNAGTVAMTAGATLRLTLPTTITLVDLANGTLESPGVIRWDTPSLARGERFVAQMRYSLPTTLGAGERLAVTAELTTPSDDREAQNNRDVSSLQRTPDQPIVIVLSNMTRLAQRGPVEEARAELARYLETAPGLEIALDAAPPCAQDATSLACRYDAWDAATRTLREAWHAQASDAAIKTLATATTTARVQLVRAIIAYVASKLGPITPAPLAIYLIGDDDVIPLGAKPDAEGLDPRSNPEWKYAAALPANDTLFGLFRSNAYPTDRPYAQIGTLHLVPSRQPGGPSAIAAALRLYQQKNGVLRLDRGLIAGFAPELTEDTQQQVCNDLLSHGVALGGQNCATVPPRASDALSQLLVGGNVASISAHADRSMIGDLGVEQLKTLGLTDLNLLLLLGCHSGVTAGLTEQEQATLITEFSRQGQPTIGYLSYAYAAGVPNMPVLAYAELMQLRLVTRLLQGNTSLAQAFGAALADYGPPTTALDDFLHQKTVDTVTLFGPPTYRVQWTTPSAPVALTSRFTLASNAAAAPLTVTSDQSDSDDQDGNDDQGDSDDQDHGQLGAITSLTVTISYAPVDGPFGRYYQAQPSLGTPDLMLDRGLPIQPYVNIILAQPVGGVRIKGGTFETIPGVNPVIFVEAPVGEPIGYTEPAYGGGSIDRAISLRTYVDGDGRTHLIILGGQWLVAGQTERLLTSLQVDLLPPRSREHSPELEGHAASCRTNDQVHFAVPTGEAIERMELVLIEAGRFTVYPMERHGHRWTATIAAQPWSDYFMQAEGSDGSVSFDTNAGNLYRVPDAHTPCGTGCEVSRAQEDLALVALSPGRMQFTNTSNTCHYEVGVAAYERHEGADNQRPHDIHRDHNTRSIGPGEAIILEVAPPACNGHVDAFIGPVISDPNPPDYADRLLASQNTQTGNRCTP